MNGWATISFLPVCSNCKRIVRDKVQLVKKIEPVNDRNRVLNEWEVAPKRCKYCGEFFDGVTIPGLPFDNSDCGVIE